MSTNDIPGNDGKKHTSVGKKGRIVFSDEMMKHMEEAAAKCPIKLVPASEKNLVADKTRVQNFNGDTGLVRWVGTVKTSWGKGPHAFVQFDIPLPMNPLRSDGVFEKKRLVEKAPEHSMAMVPIRHLYLEIAPECVVFLRQYFGERVSFLHDVELLKFWIARKFICLEVLKMLEHHLEWLQEVNMQPEKEWFHPSMAEGFPIGAAEGTDIDGNLLHFARPGNGGKISPGDFFNKYGLNACTRWHMIEIAEMKERLRKGGFTTARRVTVVYDLKNLGSVGGGIMDFAKAIAAIDQHHNPEVMGRAFMINAPLLFRAAYKMIGLFIDERVKDKIKVLGSDYKEKVGKYIPPKYFPSFMGGTNDSWLSKGGRIGIVPPKDTTAPMGGQEAKCIAPTEDIDDDDKDASKAPEEHQNPMFDPEDEDDQDAEKE